MGTGRLSGTITASKQSSRSDATVLNQCSISAQSNAPISAQSVLNQCSISAQSNAPISAQSVLNQCSISAQSVLNQRSPEETALNLGDFMTLVAFGEMRRTDASGDVGAENVPAVATVAAPVVAGPAGIVTTVALTDDDALSLALAAAADAARRCVVEMGDGARGDGMADGSSFEGTSLTSGKQRPNRPYTSEICREESSCCVRH